MAFTVGEHDNRGPYVLAPKGYFPAKCTSFKYLGEMEVEWKGEKKKQKKITFTWELSGPVMDDGRPYSITQRYTVSAGDNAKLRQHITSWLDKPSMTEEEFKKVDLESLVGSCCQLLIEHRVSEGKTFANVTSIGAAPLVNFATLSQRIEQCWTHPGLDQLKNDCMSAFNQGQITQDELNQLAALSRAKRPKIDEQNRVAAGVSF